jgi:peptidoglycan/xylan/chitin deacetylase (PgdA/CDA1 family)
LKVNRPVYNFLFHRVHPERDQLWDPMDPQLFESCLKYIRKKFQVCQIENIEKTDLTSSQPVCTISFDDGYKDNIVYASDLLAKYNMPASFYVVTDCINNNVPTWTYIFDYYFSHSQLSQVDIHFDFIPEIYHIQSFSTPAKKLEYAQKLKPILKQISNRSRQVFLDHLQKAFYDVEMPAMMMSWKDINELKNSGHQVGSHSVSHPMFENIDDEQELFAELNNSALTIEKETGVFPLTISYPIGSYTPLVIDLAKKVGYKKGLAVKQKIYQYGLDNDFEIPRMELYNESWWKTRLRLNNSIEKIKNLVR